MAATAAVAGAAATAAYWPVLDSWFVGDDLENVLGGRYGGPHATQSTHAARNFRPFHLWSLGWNHRVGGLDPVGYHLVNLGLHVVSALLVATLVLEACKRVAPTSPARGARVASLLAGALFLLAPNHVEAVAWIDARSDLAATALLLGALVAWIRATAHGDGATRRGRLVAAALLFAAALGWKESGAPFPLMIAVIAATSDGERRARRAAVAAAPFAAIVAAYLLVRRVRLGAVVDGGLVASLAGEEPLVTARRGVAVAVRAVLPGMAAGWWVAAAGGTVVVGATRAVIRRRRATAPPATPAATAGRVATRRAALGWIAAAAVAVVPVAHLGVSATSTGGERLAYLPSALAAVGGGLLAAGAPIAPRRLVLAGVPLVAVATAALVVLNLRWAAAAHHASDVADALGALPVDQPIHLIGLPEVERGVYVMRNATAPTLVLAHGWRHPAPVDELALVTIDDGGRPELTATRVGDRRWRFAIVDDGATFSAVAGDDGAWDVAGVSVRRRGAREIEVTWADDPPPVAYLSGGALVPLAVGTE